MTIDLGIDYFNRGHPLTRLQIRSSLKIRRSIYEWFANQIGGISGKTFLDYGSTPDTTRGDSNCFIRWLLEDDGVVYATSPEEIDHLRSLFPRLRTIPWPPSSSTTSDLDFVISSAVLEHVGSKESQLEHLNALFEAGNGVLITTPNRNHWMEFHTKLPLLHWLPRKYHRSLLSVFGMDFWSKEENLNLLTKRDLDGLIDSSSHQENFELSVDWYQPRLLGLVSNLVVLLRRLPSTEDHLLLNPKTLKKKLDRTI